jgi:hypothetical protein
VQSCWVPLPSSSGDGTRRISATRAPTMMSTPATRQLLRGRRRPALAAWRMTRATWIDIHLLKVVRTLRQISEHLNASKRRASGSHLDEPKYFSLAICMHGFRRNTHVSTTTNMAREGHFRLGGSSSFIFPCLHGFERYTHSRSTEARHSFDDCLKEHTHSCTESSQWL